MNGGAAGRTPGWSGPGRCLPGRPVVMVADRRDAARAWRDPVQQVSRASWLPRRRREAAIAGPPPLRAPPPPGRPRRTGKRRGPR